jgi:hypothetical protein
VAAESRGTACCWRPGRTKHAADGLHIGSPAEGGRCRTSAYPPAGRARLAGSGTLLSREPPSLPRHGAGWVQRPPAGAA